MGQAIEVMLPSSALYVSGTVNGTAVTWTNTDGDRWQAIADRSEDEKYRVSLTIISGSGQSSQADFTLYYGILNLITDRTQADVDRVRYLNGLWHTDPETGAVGFLGTDSELEEWFAGLKGAYNATDLNRVGAAVEYVANRFAEYGYTVAVNPKKDWSVQDLPTAGSMRRYLEDVQALRDVQIVFPTTPEVPADMDGLTYTEANNIEQILKDVDQIISMMLLSFWYSGEIFCGEA